jgi:hypothetical protein
MARPRTAERSVRDPSRPLTEEEKQQIVRLLSEPMEFPNEYRAWVKNYIETVGIQLPRSSIVGLKQATTTTARQVLDERLPPGSVFLFAGEEPPPGTERYETPGREALVAPPGLIYVVVKEPQPVQS